MSDGGNNVSGLVVPIHTDIEDPLETLKRVNHTMTNMKAQRLEAGEPMIMKAANVMPSFIQSGLGVLANISPKLDLTPTPVNTVITNVPGFRVPFYLAGAKAVKFHGVGILGPGVGLFHTVGSYLDYMTLSFLACRDQMPDPEVYEKAINDAFEEVYAAARSAVSPPRGKQAPTAKTRAKAKPKARATAKTKAKPKPKTGTKGTVSRK